MIRNVKVLHHQLPCQCYCSRCGVNDCCAVCADSIGLIDKRIVAITGKKINLSLFVSLRVTQQVNVKITHDYTSFP